MTPQDRIERSKARALAYEMAAHELKGNASAKTFVEHDAFKYVATELMKKSRFYSDEARKMESTA